LQPNVLNPYLHFFVMQVLVYPLHVFSPISVS
jgi:hypothetical protein